MSDTAPNSLDLDDLYALVEDILSRDVFQEGLRRIQHEFSDLIDDVAAGYVLVAEKGRLQRIEGESPDLKDGAHVTVEGRITRVDRLRTFTRKDGTTGQVISIYISRDTRDKEDDPGEVEDVRISFWENRDIERVLTGEVQEGNHITVINGRVKINNYGTTVNVGKYSKVKFNP